MQNPLQLNWFQDNLETKFRWGDNRVHPRVNNCNEASRGKNYKHLELQQDFNSRPWHGLFSSFFAGHCLICKHNCKAHSSCFLLLKREIRSWLQRARRANKVAKIILLLYFNSLHVDVFYFLSPEKSEVCTKQQDTGAWLVTVLCRCHFRVKQNSRCLHTGYISICHFDLKVNPNNVLLWVFHKNWNGNYIEDPKVFKCNTKLPGSSLFTGG